MGTYVNPPTMTKEEFLEHNGEEVQHPTWDDREPDKSLVCLVDNGMFTAAGVAFDEAEFAAFNEPGDPRPKRWFLVDTKRLEKVSGP